MSQSADKLAETSLVVGLKPLYFGELPEIGRITYLVNESRERHSLNSAQRVEG